MFSKSTSEYQSTTWAVEGRTTSQLTKKYKWLATLTKCENNYNYELKLTHDATQQLSQSSQQPFKAN